MSFAERIADQAAQHFSELRQRRVPLLPAVAMTLVFHHTLCRAVLYDDNFEPAIVDMLAPIAEKGA